MKHLKKVFSFLLIAALFFCFVSAANGTTVVYVTRTGTVYHRDGCSYLKSRIKTTLEDAVYNGYSRCSRCSPPSLDNSPYVDNDIYTSKYESSGNSYARYTEAEYQGAIKAAKANAQKSAEAAAHKKIADVQAENDRKIAALERKREDTIFYMGCLTLGIGCVCFFIGGTYGRRKVEKEYQKKEAERKKFEEEKLIHIEKFRGMSCREYAHVPDNVVFNADLLPVKIGNVPQTVYMNKTLTKYHRQSCRYASVSKPANIFSLSRCEPCRICAPPRLPEHPRWLRDYRYYMSIKKKYDIPDPDIPIAVLAANSETK